MLAAASVAVFGPLAQAVKLLDIESAIGV